MRLVVVSNRVAVPDGSAAQAGGMTVGIVGALKAHGGLWLGWSGQLVDGPTPERHHHADGAVEYVTLDLPASGFQGYYTGLANQVLWPLLHTRPDLVAYRRDNYDAYLAINALFADELTRVLRPDDVVWIHDYHLRISVVHPPRDMQTAWLCSPVPLAAPRWARTAGEVSPALEAIVERLPPGPWTAGVSGHP